MSMKSMIRCSLRLCFPSSLDTQTLLSIAQFRLTVNALSAALQHPLSVLRRIIVNRNITNFAQPMWNLGTVSSST